MFNKKTFKFKIGFVSVLTQSKGKYVIKYL